MKIKKIIARILGIGLLFGFICAAGCAIKSQYKSEYDLTYMIIAIGIVFVLAAVIWFFGKLVDWIIKSW